MVGFGKALVAFGWPWSDLVRLWSDLVRLWSDLVGLWSDLVRLWSDLVRLWLDLVGLWSDLVMKISKYCIHLELERERAHGLDEKSGPSSKIKVSWAMGDSFPYSVLSRFLLVPTWFHDRFLNRAAGMSKSSGKSAFFHSW
jgi:hypothetical protein